MPNLQKPSLPEPEGPPPPPPTQNGYAFTNIHFNPEAQKAMNTLKKSKVTKDKEPIYESIKPRPEPVGGSGNSPPSSEYRSYKPAAPPQPALQQQQQQQHQQQQQQQHQQQQNHHQQHQLQQQQPQQQQHHQPEPVSEDSQYGFGNLKLQPEENIYQPRTAAGRKRAGSSSPQPASSQPGQFSQPQPQPGLEEPQPIVITQETDREQRRLLRVRRELEKIQEVNEEEAAKKESEQHEMIEFAENYFNDHEKSPSGTIVGTIKRSKTMEILPKSDMLKFYKGSSIPNSHIHMFDPENVSLACNIFKDLVKYAKGDLKGDPEISTIQQMIQLGLEREELRDEIYVQIVRQLTDNPHHEQTERLWLLLCLVVVAFPTGKAFYKVNLRN